MNRFFLDHLLPNSALVKSVEITQICSEQMPSRTKKNQLPAMIYSQEYIKSVFCFDYEICNKINKEIT